MILVFSDEKPVNISSLPVCNVLFSLASFKDVPRSLFSSDFIRKTAGTFLVVQFLNPVKEAQVCRIPGWESRSHMPQLSSHAAIKTLQ